jgi:hypothetical protein
MLSTQVLEGVRSAIRESPRAVGIVVLDDEAGRVTAASAFGAALPTAVELVARRPLEVDLVAPDQTAGAGPLVRAPDTIVLRVNQGTVTLVR